MNRREFHAALLAGAAGLALPPLGVAGADGVHPAVRLPDPPAVNGARLNEQLAALARFGANPQGGVSRVAYGDADLKGRAYVTELMRAAKLQPTVDAAGNIIGRRAGRDAARKPLLFGSHIDSVPEGGNYDGPVGSLGAIEVARTLAESGIVTRHPLEVTIWQNEEGGLVGSRAVSGQLEEKELAMRAASGRTWGEGIALLGGDVARLASVKRARGDIAAYLELHIEQGGTLDREQVEIGVVEGIVGIGRWEVTVTGVSNHAGTTAMADRHDALLAASMLVQAVNRVARARPGRQVATVGRIQAFPGAPNVIPGRVALIIEVRDLDAAVIAAVHRDVVAEGERIAKETGTSIAYVEETPHVPAMADERVRGVIARSAKALGLSTRSLPSGAGHDAQSMALLGPMGMIFVPSVGGISHSPKEFTKPADITNGANVLLRTLLALDAELA
jgi:N-carbamoyl-L-amino-acid hydrolase